MTHRPGVVELDADRMRALLDQLNERLIARGVAASLYVVGGAAMALAYGRQAVTPDIDALASHHVVFEESHAMATEHGLPLEWLNSNASGWVPPPPEWARQRPTRIGLTIHVAPPEHLLAMKLIALRRKDRPDIRLLIQRCGMIDADAEQYADLLATIYPGEDQLAQMLGVGSDPAAVRREAVAIGQWAHDFVADLRPAT